VLGSRRGYPDPLRQALTSRGGKAMSDERTNWAGNYGYRARHFYRPETVEEIQEIVSKSERVKAVGSRHCFNDLADSREAQISLQNFRRIIALDDTAMMVTIESGLQYGQFCPELCERGFALNNLASLPHISVVGACATATHGSGVKNKNLAAAVSALEFVSGRGEVVTLTREKDGDKFNGAVVNLGALGIVTKLTLEIEKAFEVRQDCFEQLALADLKENFEKIIAAGHSVSLFTTWQQPEIDQIWIKSRLDQAFTDFGGKFCGARAALQNLHPISGISAENCTGQMGAGGPWYERLPHFKMGFTPSAGAELQSEYFVARENAVEAVFALERIREQIAPLLLVSEIRTIAADEMWLSMNYKRDSAAFHFTWRQDVPAVMRVLPILETALAPFAPRPHWGKLFTMTKEQLRTMYERLPDFIELMRDYDPAGKFRNDYLERNIL
jgi:xylitol oxidase